LGDCDLFTFLDDVTSSLNDVFEEFTSQEIEMESESDPPPQQEANPDFVLIDDMILSPLQYDIIFTEPSKRNGYSSVGRPWPNAVIPYMIDDDYSINDIYCCQSFSLHIHTPCLGAAEKSIIRTAMSVIERETCGKSGGWNVAINSINE
jgi:hypothetical protein